MTAEFCRPCKERGRLAVAVHPGQTPMCEACFHGGNAEAMAKCSKSNVVVQEETMAKICACGCGEKLNANNTKKFKTGHGANGKSEGGPKRGRPPRHSHWRAKGGAGADGRVKSDGELVLCIPATDGVADSRWDELTLAEKVRALNSLHE